MDPHLTNGAYTHPESDRLKKQITDLDNPHKLSDLSHLKPPDAERKTATVAARGGRNRRRTATPPKAKGAAAAAAASTIAAATTAGRRGGRRRSLHPSDERQARHPRDEALTPQEGASRLQSPDARAGAGDGAQRPTVDFDGLSWPSAYRP
jgi:hypothetical protein